MSENERFLSFIDQAPTAWHAVSLLAKRLEEAGFTALNEGERWRMEAGGRYYVTRNQSALIAFILPEKAPEGMMIAAAHSDSPTFKLKMDPELGACDRYTRVNAEPYGGMLMYTWLDRPLSVAGRLVVREGGEVVSRLVRCDRDLCVIPSVEIHMNREENNGYAWKPNVDLLPLWGSEQAAGSVLACAAEAAGVDPEAIVGHDLYLYNRVPGRVWGVKDEYISGGRLDDLECAWSCAEALIAAAPTDRLPVCCVFDNEEVGSGTRQGADAGFLGDVIERVCDFYGMDAADRQRMVAGSLMASADNAHAVHPNHPEYSDPANRVWMNKGIVIKHNARQKYITDAVSCGLFTEICRAADVPVQHFSNRSDMPGGSTLGNLAVRHVAVPAVDIGLAQLAMHSAWETAGALDLPLMLRALTAFYAAPLTLLGDGRYRLG